MSEVTDLRIEEQLGAAHRSVLIEVPSSTPAARRGTAGPTLSVQRAPRLAFDPPGDSLAAFVLTDVAPDESLTLQATDNASPAADAFTIAPDGAHIAITGGGRSVRVPATGMHDPPYPGPIAGLRLGDGEWYGASVLTHAPGRGQVETVIESSGPNFIQWRTTFRWGTVRHTFRARWAANTDTVLIEEESSRDTDAAIEWLPFSPDIAPAYTWGGGESRTGPMKVTAMSRADGFGRLAGRRILNWLSHISYFNQWNMGWCGFARDGDSRFAGLFTGWSPQWRNRGHVRPEIIEDDALGCLVRFPIKQGRRLWGLLFTTRDESAVDSSTQRCLLNRRKAQLADLPLAKTARWDLDPPIETRELRLIRAEDFATFRERLALDPDIPAAFSRYLETAKPDDSAATAAGVWANNEALLTGAAGAMVSWADSVLAEMADGGYERVIIFDGRHAKRVCGDLDVIWHLGLIDETAYRRVRKALLALAYVFVDPAYCRYEDFWTEDDAPSEGVADAMRDDIGDCPVPPNFASEFFTTTGVVAELFPSQREHAAWRAESVRLADRFFAHWYEADGTYLESMNYHNHGFNEMLCQLYVQQVHGVRDWLADPKVAGSFEHFAHVRLPEVSNCLLASDPASGRLAQPDRPTRSPLPADSNSGSHGNEQEFGGQLALGAWLYRDRNPALAGELMAAWRENGKPLLDNDHTILTLMTIDPSIQSKTQPRRSVRRLSLGVFSRDVSRTGEPIWGLFRCGHATHHMDFDHGNVRIAAYGRVLLGDHGYHSHDNDNKPVGGANTWIHNTVSLGADRWNSSGNTGLEVAPDPKLVHLGRDFDYAVHTMVTDNLRLLNKLGYREMLPVPTTVHTRHYLFVKPDYFVVWDTFAECPFDTMFWLHPTDPVRALSGGAFHAGIGDGPGLRIQFVLPAEPEIVQNEQFGPLWSLGIRQRPGAPYLAVLHPQPTPQPLTAALAADGRTLTVTGDAFADTITLPTPASTDLPRLTRG